MWMTEEEYKAFLQKHRLRDPIITTPAHVQAANPIQLNDTPKKRSKYGNTRVEVDGKKFDSIHEADVYRGLMMRVRAGELKCVCCQVPFDLPGGIKYIADFVTIDHEMRIEGVYDAKSAATKKNRVYINKKKQMRACWGIEIREV